MDTLPSNYTAVVQAKKSEFEKAIMDHYAWWGALIGAAVGFVMDYLMKNGLTLVMPVIDGNMMGFTAIGAIVGFFVGRYFGRQAYAWVLDVFFNKKDAARAVRATIGQVDLMNTVFNGVRDGTIEPKPIRQVIDEYRASLRK